MSLLIIPLLLPLSGPALMIINYYEAYRYGDNSWNIGYELVEGVEHPDIVGTGDVSYSINFWVTANGLVPAGGTVPEHYLKGDNGWYVRDEEGKLIEIWSPDEELVFLMHFTSLLTRCAKNCIHGIRVRNNNRRETEWNSFPPTKIIQEKDCSYLYI